MTEKHLCAECQNTNITVPLCSTCAVWFCEACTAEILTIPNLNEWIPCRQIDGGPCSDRARVDVRPRAR